MIEWTGPGLTSLDLTGLPVGIGVAMDAVCCWVVRYGRVVTKLAAHSQTGFPLVPEGASRIERAELLRRSVVRALKRAGVLDVDVRVRPVPWPEYPVMLGEPLTARPRKSNEPFVALYPVNASEWDSLVSKGRLPWGKAKRPYLGRDGFDWDPRFGV